MSEYWENHWNNIPENIDKQRQVGRTVNKNPIQEQLFQKTLSWVAEQMQINKTSCLLELCCGNGVWTIPYSKLVKRITAIDFSASLLNVLKKEIEKQKINNVDIILENIAVMDWKKYNHFTHIFLQFALQNFSEQEVILLFENVYSVLKIDGGIFYIGDIPDRSKLWCFANTVEYEKMYFDSIKKGTPKIGTWFIKDDLAKMASYTGFNQCKIIEQPDWLFNSNYRFDMKLEVL